jgi:quercetin dioxygenase-like cupin family protein
MLKAFPATGQDMKRIALIVALALGACASAAAQGEPVATPLATITTTNSGQPIVLPQGPVQVSVSQVTIPAGARLPVHKHPYPRYAYVQAGRLKVTNIDTGGEALFGPGGFIVEALGQWHTGEALGDEDVRLLVIDQVAPGQVNMVRREP